MTLLTEILQLQQHVCAAGAIPKHNGYFGQGTGNQPILLDNVQCRGGEHRLIDCFHRGIEVSDCDHSRDAGVICIEG